MSCPRALRALLAATAAASAACGYDFDPPDRAARVERLTERYTPALFDSVTWDDPGERLLLGNTVYAERCSRCHGALGSGVTPYAEVRRLEVPSIVQPGWPMAELDSVRRKLFTGHEAGMPTFGEGSLGVREIDAAAAYVLETLRPEVLGRRDF